MWYEAWITQQSKLQQFSLEQFSDNVWKYNVLLFLFFFSSLELSQKNNQGILHRIRHSMTLLWPSKMTMTNVWKIYHSHSSQCQMLSWFIIHLYIYIYTFIHISYQPKQTVVIIFTFAYALSLHGRLQNKLFLDTIPSEVNLCVINSIWKIFIK